MMKNFFTIISAAITIVFLHNSASLYSQEPEPVLPGANEQNRIIWIDGKLPADSVEQGQWLWDQGIKDQDSASHTEPSQKTLYSHSFASQKSIHVDKDSRLIQRFLLDTKDFPKGVMIKLAFRSAPEISLYWEGDEEAFAGTEEYRSAWYMGMLSQSGQWQEIKVSLSELDISQADICGMSFIASNGKVWWGETIIEGGRYVQEEAQGQAPVAQQEG